MALAFFHWKPKYVYSLVDRHKVLVSDMDNGSQRRYWKGKRPRRWQLTFTKNYEEINEIYAFWKNRRGSFESFYIILPNGIAQADERVKVHFVGEDIETQFHGTVAGTISLTIEEDL